MRPQTSGFISLSELSKVRLHCGLCRHTDIYKDGLCVSTIQNISAATAITSGTVMIGQYQGPAHTQAQLSIMM